MTMWIRNARVLTMAGPRPRRGKALGDLGVIDRADVRIDDRTITAVLEPGKGVADEDFDLQVDARGRVLMPAFVDCHTHACWAGDRLDEWAMRLKGAAYLDILKAGGGIMSTVRAVRGASADDLAYLLYQRLMVMRSCGTGAMEVKSGYGLSTEAELKMLDTIAAVGRERTLHETLPLVVRTALLGHAVDADGPGGTAGFVDRTISETLPAVHERHPGVPIDAYCEQGAWSVADTVRLFEAARTLGHPLRVHADQFNSLGMIGEAVRLGARSVDHLEASTPEDLERLAQSETFGVLLPCSGLHVDGRYADGRRLVDAGGLVAIATNYNPGSAPCPDMAMAIALAVRFCGLSPEEAIAAATVNGAAVLGLEDCGTIEAGQPADLVLLRHTDERMLAFEFGGRPIEMAILGERMFLGG
jgi:imidazolonepropionase